jgi:flagellin
MALYINTNISSLQAQKNLATSQRQLQQSFERLSSGFRINTAADDAAGMAVSESMRSQIRSYNVAERNANNAISMTQTAEGGLSHISSILIRMRELAVQSANGDLTSTDRNYIDTEFQLLKDEITRLAETTEFNGKELLAGSAVTFDFQVGINTSSFDVIQVSFGGISLNGIGLSGISVSGATAVNSVAAIDAVDLAFTQVSTQRANLGAAQNRVEISVANTQSIRTNLSAANSRIRDVDVAEETSQLARTQVLLQAGTAILAQANQQPNIALALLNG